MDLNRRILHAGVALVAVCVAAAFAPASAKDYSAQLQNVAATLNAHLPRQLDKATRLDHTEAGPGNTFTYDFTLVSIASGTPKAQKVASAVRGYVLDRACHNPSVTNMLDMGVTMRYVYRGSDGGQVASFALHAADCSGA